MTGMTETDADATWRVFDAVEIDTAGRRLWVNGIEVSLEPKAFDALMLLVERAGRVCTREELLDAVWGHRHITPSVLSRVVTLLRHALGERGDEPRYLHTLHGIGYRFDAQVRAVSYARVREDGGAVAAEVSASDASGTVAAAALAAAVPAALDFKQTAGNAVPTSTSPALVSDAAGSAVLTPTADSALPHPAPRGMWLRPTRRQWALVATLAALAIVAVWVWVARQPQTRAISTTPTLVVLPLRAVGGGHDESALAEGLSEELTTRLARAEGLQVISSTSARLAQEQHLDPAQLAQRAGTTHALEGSLREAGEALRIDLRLIETPSGRTLWAQDYDRKLADVFAIQREIAQAVAAALALHLGVAATAPSASGDVDVALYREYLQLRNALLNLELTPGSPKQKAALTALRALIARAPDYARAHGLLARFDVMWSFMDAARKTEVEREATRALQLDPDDSDAHFALAQVGCSNFDWETCLAGYQHVVELDPTDITARSSHAFFLAGIGYLDAAVKEFGIGRRSDPLHYLTLHPLARTLDTLGRHDEAKKIFDVLAKQDEAAAYLRWYNAVWRHDYAAALQFAAQTTEQNGYRKMYLAITAALQDARLWPQALQAIEETERSRGRYNYARQFSPGYDAQAFLAGIEPMLAGWGGNFAILAWQAEYPELRKTSAFQDYIKRTHMLDYWRAHGFPPQCKPDGDGARCY